MGGCADREGAGDPARLGLLCSSWIHLACPSPLLMLPTAAPPAQAANLWGQGVDKLPLWGRYKWVEDHLAQIVGESRLEAGTVAVVPRGGCCWESVCNRRGAQGMHAYQLGCSRHLLTQLPPCPLTPWPPPAPPLPPIARRERDGSLPHDAPPVQPAGWRR